MHNLQKRVCKFSYCTKKWFLVITRDSDKAKYLLISYRYLLAVSQYPCMGEKRVEKHGKKTIKIRGLSSLKHTHKKTRQEKGSVKALEAELF